MRFNKLLLLRNLQIIIENLVNTLHRTNELSTFKHVNMFSLRDPEEVQSSNDRTHCTRQSYLTSVLIFDGLIQLCTRK